MGWYWTRRCGGRLCHVWAHRISGWPVPLPCRVEDQASAARATPFRYVTPTNRPDQLNFPFHPDQDQHAGCTPSLLHFPLFCRRLRHYSLHPLTTPTTGVLTLAGTSTITVALVPSRTTVVRHPCTTPIAASRAFLHRNASH
jgi:hypothetical protein